ncbi:Protein of uncharacterised function (DUF1120) [Pseudomonas fluorescens]|uniref:Protein of uncharacterized function (DUF1120) n=1 Tax=Pseudomonas fluorescens TaxID=294 RepID=A0A379IIL5_PSEFL|nr:DUF1120 domain-containing protein [Pseudomonas fluorescens]AIG02812.1 hypothetical protein HZ99_11805 [Pseudomonas fluorescens]SUD33236.1 Protein of uncharacterised function (DUF1120) [Pseudomonas fluorescens]
MSTFIPRLLVTFVLAPSAFAVSTTDLAVKGAITPNACEPMISSGGVVDFGKMSAKSLNADQHTDLPRQILTLSVRCEGPAFFTLNTIDNRAGSSANHHHWHGLGMTPSGEKLGGAGFGLYNAVADSEPVQTIVSEDGGATWATAVLLSHTGLTAVAQAGTSVPRAVKELDAELRLYTHIAPANGLSLVDEVPIDGHATVQLKYL